MNLIIKLRKKVEEENVDNTSSVSETKNVGMFSNMADGGLLQREVKDRSYVDIYHFEDEENLTEEQWARLAHLVMLGNPEGEYISSSSKEERESNKL